MKYSRVCIQSFGYELPPHVVTSDDLEARLEPIYIVLRYGMWALKQEVLMPVHNNKLERMTGEEVTNPSALLLFAELRFAMKP